MSTYAPFAKPLYVMLKPVGAVCNLACDYCYYLEKSKLYVNNPKHVMSDPASERVQNSSMTELIFTDSIPYTKKCDKVHILSIADLFADTIRRVYENKSISSQYLL